MALPKQSSIRTASGGLKRNARRAVAEAEDAEQSGGISAELLEKLKRQQAKIDEYNNDIIYKIDPKFKDLCLTGEYIIVRLYCENLIKFLDESNPEDVQVDAWHRQIDARKRATDMPHWVSTPFPYLNQGVIVAISPELRLKALRSNMELHNMPLHEDLLMSSQFHIPSVGDIVNIRAYESGWFKDHRYYLDKQAQCQDFVRNQEELRLNKFEHYFILEAYDLESYITNTPKRGEYYEEPTTGTDTGTDEVVHNDEQRSDV